LSSNSRASPGKKILTLAPFFLKKKKKKKKTCSQVDLMVKPPTKGDASYETYAAEMNAIYGLFSSKRRNKPAFLFSSLVF